MFKKDETNDKKDNGNKEVKKLYGEILLDCPRCKVKMRKLKKNDIIIDVCKKCNGMWLDNNEVNKLIEMSKNHFKNK
ncbi:MAG: zf-TFIIB domain-containing protein [Candidatus Woesearchaeota archaeon]